MRLFVLAVVLAALSACAAPAPRPADLHPGASPFQAVAPAGYCLSDESDPLALAFVVGMTRNAPPDRRILAVFRPCSEPGFTKGLTTWNSFRLIFQIEDGPTTGPGRPAMDRETYLTLLANPKLTELWNRRTLPGLQDGRSRKTEGARYLGSDGDAVYNGLTFTPRNPAPGVDVEARVVLAETLVDGTALKLHVINMAANSAPVDWTRLQAIAAQATHATIAAAERPGRAPPPAAPARPSPAAPGGAGLTT